MADSDSHTIDVRKPYIYGYSTVWVHGAGVLHNVLATGVLPSQPLTVDIGAVH